MLLLLNHSLVLRSGIARRVFRHFNYCAEGSGLPCVAAPRCMDDTCEGEIERRASRPNTAASSFPLYVNDLRLSVFISFAFVVFALAACARERVGVDVNICLCITSTYLNDCLLVWMPLAATPCQVGLAEGAHTTVSRGCVHVST